MLEFQVKKLLGQTLIDVSLSIAGTGITVLYGHSGAGKTSVINMLAGLLRPDEGRIVLGERVLFDSSLRINVPTYKRKAGYVFQDKRLFPFINVKRNLLFGRGESTSVSFDEVVEILGISDLLDRKPAFLSGGEAQRVAIGRAMLSSPDFLLMDEPMSSLDYDRKEELIPFIAKLSGAFGIPIILVTHAYDEMIRLADYVVVMGGGKCLRQGQAAELFKCPSHMPAGFFCKMHSGGHCRSNIENVISGG